MKQEKPQALLFDWGNTVMHDFGYPGPMAHWNRVAAVHGAGAALAQLAPHYRLILATNAIDSGADLVREALRRAELAEFFEAVFTSRELEGRRKPEPAFFLALLEALDLQPAQAAMVGDNYRTDVTGAKLAGLQAVWFNPAGAPCPLTHPLHDAQVAALAQLPTALQSLPPDLLACLRLLQQQGVEDNLLRHVETVAAVAFYLAQRLRQHGRELDPLLVHRGALLHDLDKFSARRQKRQHGTLGAEILSEQGYPKLAEIVRRHPIFALEDPELQPRTWEEKLVHYADKLVEDDRLVSVRRRVASLAERHPQHAASLWGTLPALLELEREFCEHLGIEADELMGELKTWLENASPHPPLGYENH
ncbi:MAG: HAD-IA family hydrolase [Chloroflexia bacterium]|nr:HAD-IA family hydrolase [Chloroflexia bacterium]